MKTKFTKILLVSTLVLLGLCNNANSQSQWIQTNTLPPGGSVWAMATIGNNLFAGTASGGVYFSNDDGASWIQRNGAFPSMQVYSFAVSGNDIYAGTGAGGGSAGIYKSSDNGLNWINVTPSTMSGVYQVKALTVNSTHIFAGTHTGGIFMSLLSGISSSSWSSFNTGLTNESIFSLKIKGTTIYAGTYGDGVWISPTNSPSWSLTSSTMPVYSDYIQALDVSGTTIFAGNRSGLPVLYRSIDNGTNWIQSNTNIFNDKPVNAIYNNGSEVYVGTDSSGMFLSTDNGITWSQYNQGFKDSLGTWFCNQINVRSIVFTGTNIFAGTDCGVWKRSLPCIGAPSAGTITGTSNVCVGSSFSINASGYSNPVSGIIYQWQNDSGCAGNWNNIQGQNLPAMGTFTQLIPTCYRLSVLCTISGISSVSNIINVDTTNNSNATIISGGSNIICGNSTELLTASLGNSYQWYKNNIIISGSTNQIYSANASGSYTCVVGLSCGMNTSNAIQITKYTLPTITLTTSGPTTFCNGDSVIISASSNAGGFATWQWYKDNVVIVGATNNSYKATTAGTYKCTVTNSSTTCSRISTGIVVSLLTTTASITAGSSTTFCIGGNVLLTAVTNAGAGSTYQWYLNSTIIGGATNTTYTASATGNYSFTVNNSNGCNATSSATSVTVNPLPVVTITPSGSTIICPSGTLSLTASTGASYLWSTAATTQTIIVSTAGNYSVTVTNANGCSAASTPTSVSLSVCETPTNITATNIIGSSATINWTGNNCAAKYRVHVRALGTTTWSTLIVTAPTTTKNITGLQPITTYEYQVRTDCNTAGTVYSAYSTIQTFTTICNCTKPTNIAVSNVTQTGATVSWLGNLCAVKYRLQYRVQGTTAWTTKTTTAPIVTKTLTLLTPNTIYEYRLRSDCNSTGTINSGYTTIATITTIPRLEDTEISSSTFYVSPNPCSTCFVNGTMDEQDLIVTDIVGRKINVQFTKSGSGFYINMLEANPGFYFIRNMKTGEVVKFVKE